MAYRSAPSRTNTISYHTLQQLDGLQMNARPSSISTEYREGGFLGVFVQRDRISARIAGSEKRERGQMFASLNEKRMIARTATKKCGFVGWNRTRWTEPLIFLNGDWEWRLLIWCIQMAPCPSVEPGVAKIRNVRADLGLIGVV